MAGIKQKSRARRQRKRVRQHKQSVFLISCTMLLLVIVTAVGAMSLQAKNNAYKEQMSELQAQLKEEKERSGEIDDMQGYVGTQEYIEDIAREKLGLVYPNEIIMKPEQ